MNIVPGVLFYLFLAALGLGCFTRAFSSSSEQGPLSSCGMLGFSFWWFFLLQSTHSRKLWLRWLGYAGSVVEAHGLSSSGSVAVVHRLSCPTACGVLPDQGLSPPQAGRFSTTAPPEQSCACCFQEKQESQGRE